MLRGLRQGLVGWQVRLVRLGLGLPIVNTSGCPLNGIALLALASQLPREKPTDEIRTLVFDRLEQQGAQWVQTPRP